MIFSIAVLTALNFVSEASSGSKRLSVSSSKPTEKRISKAPVATRSLDSILGFESRTERYFILCGSRKTLPMSLSRISPASFITCGSLSSSILTADVSIADSTGLAMDSQ